MSIYQLQIKQVVDYPRCRIYRQFIRRLMDDRSIRVSGGSGLFYFTALCSYANCRKIKKGRCPQSRWRAVGSSSRAPRRKSRGSSGWFWGSSGRSPGAPRSGRRSRPPASPCPAPGGIHGGRPPIPCGSPAAPADPWSWGCSSIPARSLQTRR